MKLFEIWMEGFSVDGTTEPAQKLGEYSADSFDAAVALYREDNPKVKIRFLPDGYKIWRCRLFDNEKQARESNG